MAETTEKITEESKEQSLLNFGFDYLKTVVVFSTYCVIIGSITMMKSTPLALELIFIGAHLLAISVGLTFFFKYFDNSNLYDNIPTIFCGDKTFDIPFNLYTYGTSYYTTPIINGYHHSVDFCVDSYNAVVDFNSSPIIDWTLDAYDYVTDSVKSILDKGLDFYNNLLYISNDS
jgi:hypothetical protein